MSLKTEAPEVIYLPTCYKTTDHLDWTYGILKWGRREVKVQ